MNKNALTHRGYHGTAELSFEDNCLHGKLLFIDDLITYEGENPQQLFEAFIQAVDRYLTYCEQTNKAPNKPFSGTFNVRFGPELHKDSAVAAFEDDQSLNDFVRDSVLIRLEQRKLAKQLQEDYHHNHVSSYDEDSVQPWQSQHENRLH